MPVFHHPQLHPHCQVPPIILQGKPPSWTNSPSTPSPAPTTPLSCGGSISQSRLDGIIEAKTKDSKTLSDFVPRAYFGGSGGVKFIISQTSRTNIDDSSLCVDGATMYSGRIDLFDDGSHGDDVAGDGIYLRDCVRFCAGSGAENIDSNDYWGFAMEKAQDLVRA